MHYLCNMDTMRTLKFAKLIRKELSEIFTVEGKRFFGNNFVTITGVTVTTDLSKARVHISVFKAAKPNDVLKNVKLHSNEIRKILGMRIRNQARIIPSLEFFIDDSLDYVEKMDNIFKNIHIPPPEEGAE
jgi:ribosome-binding factor A